MLESIIVPINEWNRSSADCVHSSSINMFKNRIDNYLVRVGYIYIHTGELSISQRLPCPQPSELLHYSNGNLVKSC